jgi:uncharacterized protein (DUF934 family)
MQIIKDNQIIDNSWTYIEDEVDLKSGDICISMNRWKNEKELLLGHEGKVGIRVSPENSTEDLTNDLGNIDLIELDFPTLADGRLFSFAWLLRGRHHYHGEIRATGHYLPDQVFYLSRVGVNAFEPEKPEDLPTLLSSLNDFSVTYQSSIK